MAARFFDFKSVSLVHIDRGPARIGLIADAALPFTDDAGTQRVIDLAATAELRQAVRRAAAKAASRGTGGGGGRYLLACALKSPGARRERLISELIVQTASGSGDGCPAGSVPADGRTVAISSDQAMFTLFGTNYGGDGKTTFKLPDLRLKSGLARQNGGALRFCIVMKGSYPGPS